jgi:hypothetical protein
MLAITLKTLVLIAKMPNFALPFVPGTENSKARLKNLL